MRRTNVMYSILYIIYLPGRVLISFRTGFVHNLRFIVSAVAIHRWYVGTRDIYYI